MINSSWQHRRLACFVSTIHLLFIFCGYPQALATEHLASKQGSDQACNTLGLRYLHQKNLARSAAQFRTAININSKNLAAWNNLGSVLYRQGLYDQAEAAYKKALLLTRGNDAEVLTNLACVLRDHGNYHQAFALYQKAIRLQSNFAPAYNNLGLALYYQHDLSGALSAVNRAIELKPDYAGAYFNKYLVLMDRHDTGGAISTLNESIAHETDLEYLEDAKGRLQYLKKLQSCEGNLTYGNELLNRHRCKEAAQVFQKVLGCVDSALAWNNLGVTLQQQGNIDGAQAAFQRALQLSRGGFSEASYNLGQAYRMKGKYADAERAVVQAIHDAGGAYPLARNALGIMHKHGGRLSEAISDYKLAIEQSNDALPVVHFNLALALEKVNNKEEAKRQFQLYLSQRPNGLNAETARLHL